MRVTREILSAVPCTIVKFVKLVKNTDLPGTRLLNKIVVSNVAIKIGMMGIIV